MAPCAATLSPFSCDWAVALDGMPVGVASAGPPSRPLVTVATARVMVQCNARFMPLRSRGGAAGR
jgi:hypothetical protein